MLQRAAEGLECAGGPQLPPLIPPRACAGEGDPVSIKIISIFLRLNKDRGTEDRSGQGRFSKSRAGKDRTSQCH